MNVEIDWATSRGNEAARNFQIISRALISGEPHASIARDVNLSRSRIGQIVDRFKRGRVYHARRLLGLDPYSLHKEGEQCHE